MKQKNLFRSLAILILLSLVFYTLLGKITDFRELPQIFKANPIFLVLAGLAWLFSYGASALKFKFVLGRRYRLKFNELIPFAMVGTFAVHFLPVGNFGESALNFYLLRRKGVPAPALLSFFLLRLIFDYFAFFFLFAIALASLPTHPSLNLVLKIILSLILITLLGGSLYLYYLLQNPKLFFRRSLPILRLLKKSLQLVRNQNESLKERYYAELAEKMRQEMLEILKPQTIILALVASLLYWCLDMLILFFALWGLGARLSLNAVLFSYLVGTLAGSISFLPAGIGALEGSILFLLSRFGTPTSLAFLGIVAYRFFSLWLAIPAGFWAFYWILRQQGSFPHPSFTFKK